MKTTTVEIHVADAPVMVEFVHQVRDFIDTYASHTRSCAATYSNGQRREGNPPCDCGYDQALAALVPPRRDFLDSRRAR